MSVLSEASEVCIILNPHAAKGRALSKRKEIEVQCKKLGISYQLFLTGQPLDAITLARNAVKNGFRTIVAAGGDGTLNEVVDGVITEREALGLSYDETPVIGLLPVGRGNDFAFFAKVPKKIDEAMQLIKENQYLPTDFGRVYGGIYPQGRCFINGVGIGFEPLVNFVASDFTHISGMLSYILGFVKVMFHYPDAVAVTVVHDDNCFTCETQQISLCNGRRMGSTFIMGPEAEIDDGLLDMVYANRPIAGNEILSYALKFFSGSQLKTDRFSLLRAREIKITTETDSLVCHADGEEVSRGCNSIAVKIYQGGIKFIRNS